MSNDEEVGRIPFYLFLYILIAAFHLLLGIFGKSIAFSFFQSNKQCIGGADLWAGLVFFNFVICSVIFRSYHLRHKSNFGDFKEQALNIAASMAQIVLIIIECSNTYPRIDILFYASYALFILFVPSFLFFRPRISFS